MSAGIDSAAVQRTRGRRNRNTGVPGCRRGLVACDAWRDDTPMGRGLAGWLAGWILGRTETRLRVWDCAAQGEREGATYWGKLSSHSWSRAFDISFPLLLAFDARPFCFSHEQKEERARRQGGCQAERPIKKSYGPGASSRKMAPTY